MEIECDLASIRDEDLLRKMWQQSEDFGRKKEIRSHLYKLRESRLREFYSTGGPGGEIMNPATDLHFGKTPLTPSHGDSLVDQSFQSLKSKEIRDSLSPTHDIKFRNSGGVAGGVLVPDTTGWDVQTSSEVSPDGRAFRTESLAKTDGVEKIPGGHAEFAGRNEQKSSASHQGDDKNYVKKAAESSKTHLQEKVVIGDENSGRTEMKSSSVTSSSKVISSSSQQVFSSDDPGFDMEPRRITNQDQRYQNVLQGSNNSTSSMHSERQQFSRNERNERQETSSNTLEESKKYVDMDKASPEYQQHVQYLMSQPGAIVSNTVEYPKPGVKMITTVKKLPDGTTVKTKRYETEASAAGADTTSISQTMKQQQKISSNTSTSQKMTEKRIQDSEDVFARLSRTRDANVPASPRNAPETPSHEDVYSRLQHARDINEQKFSDSIDQRSTQILRDSNQHPGSKNVPTRRPSDLAENVEMISKTNKTVKKDLNQSVRSEKITSSDFIQNERDRYVLDHENPSRRGPDGYPEALAPITPSRHGRPQADDYPTNGYGATEVIKQSSSSKSSAKFTENRRFSTETVESYQHSENENQDYTTRGYPSNRRPIDEPKGRSPSTGRSGPDFSTHGFPSVRSDKPTQQHPSDKPRAPEEYETTERVHIIHTDRPRTGDVSHSDTTTSTRSNYSTNETRRHVTSNNEDFSTHGFPSVRAGTPTRDSPRRPLGSDPTPSESPRRPSGQEPPAHQVRRPPTDGYSTHGFPSVKSGSPTEDSPRRPLGTEPTNQGRRPTTDDFSTHGFPSVKPGHITPTQSAPHYESSPRVDREDTVSVTSDRSNSVIYEKKIDAAHQAFARSLRCASPVESVRRDSTSDRHTPRSSIGSIRNSYSPSKRDGRSPSHDSVTNSESSRISSATVTKSHRPTEVRRLSSPKSPIGKSSPSHVSNETIDLTLTRKITARPSPDKTAGRPTITDRSPSDRPTTNNLPSPAPTTTTSTTPHNAPKSKKDIKVKSPSTTTTTTKPLSSPSKVDNSTTSRFTKTVKVENTTNRDTTTTKTRRQPDLEPESELDIEPLAEPEDLDEGYVPDRKGKRKPSSHRPTSDDEGFEPDSPRAGSPTSDFEYRRPNQVQETHDEEDSIVKKTKRTDKKVVTNDFLNTERNVTETRKPQNKPSYVIDDEKPEGKKPTDGRKPLYSVDKPTEPHEDYEPKRPLRRPKEEDTNQIPSSKDRKPSKVSDEPRNNTGLDNEPIYPDEDNRRPSYEKEPVRPEDKSSRPRGTKPPLERSETFEERCRQILGMVSETVTDRTMNTQEFIETERTTVDSNRKPTDRSPSPKKRQPSDTVSIEDCDDDDDNSYSGKITTTTTTVKTTRDYPRDRSPNKKEPTSRPKENDTGDRPRDQSPIDTHPKGPTTNEYDETTTVIKTTKITDDRSTSPNRKSQKKGKPTDEDDIRPRGRSPTERPGRVDETTAIRKTTKIVDEIDEISTRSKPGSRPRDQFPQHTRPGDKSPVFGRSPSPQKKQPSDTVSIEDCDDDSDAPSKYTTNKTTKTSVKTSREFPRDKSPISEERPNRKSPKDNKPSEPHDDFYPRGRSPSERPGKVNETTSYHKTTDIVNEINKKSIQSGPGSRPRDQSPEEKYPTNDRLHRDRSPSEKRTFITTRETTFDVDTTTRGKSPSKHPVRETSPTEVAPRDKSPLKKPSRGTSPTGEYPRDRSPTTKPVRETSPSGESPRGKSPLKKPIRGTTPTDEYPRDRSPVKKPVLPTTTDETIITSTTTNHSNVTDGFIEDRYPSYTPKSYPHDRSPIDKQKPKPHHKTEEDVTVETSKKTKKTLKEEIHDEVFEVKCPRERQPDTRDGSYISHPRDQSPSEPLSRPRTNDSPREKSPEKITKDTNEVVTTNTTKKTADTTIQSQFTDKSPESRPRDSPRGRSPSKKPTTDEETEEFRETTTIRRDTTHGPSPNDHPRDRSPVDDLSRPRTTGISETHRVDKKTVINEFLDTERGVVNRPHHPRDSKPFDNRSPDRLTSSHPRDFPVKKESQTLKPKGPTSTSIDESTTIKTKKTTKDTTIENEEIFPSTRPRDRSPTEKPMRSPKIVTTETTTEYGIRSRPRSRSPSEEPEEPLTDSEEIDKTYVQKIRKETEKRTMTTDLDIDVEKQNRRPRPTETENRPREKSPQKTKPSDRSPSPRSKYPKDQGPWPVDNRPQSRSPVGKQPKTTGSPRQNSPSEKTRVYHSTDEETNLMKKSKTTKVTTTSEDVETENRPRGRSPTEKPRPTVAYQSPKDHPRRSSPTKKPNDLEPIDRDYEVLVTRTNKTTRNETTLEEKTDRSPINYPKDKPREKSPLSNQRVPRPLEETEDRLPKSPRGSSPSKNYPRDSSPSDKPRKSEMTERTTTESTIITERSSKSPRGTSPNEKPSPKDYPRDKSPTDKSRKPRIYDGTVVIETTSESTTTKDRLSKSPRHTSPSEKPGPRDYPRDRSPTDKPNKSRPNNETSPTRKPVGRQPRPVGETVVQRTVKTITVDDRTTKTPRGSSPNKTSPRERSPTQKQPTKDSPRRTSPSEKLTRRQPIVSEVEKTVQKTTSKFSKDRTTSEKIIVKDHPRRKSPSDKPRRHPTSDEETDDDDETTETIIAVYTIDGETVKNHPRDLSPSGRPKQPNQYSPKRPQTNGDSHYPTVKPTRRQPSDEETEETFISTSTRLTKERKTFDIEEDQSPRRTYPGDKPKTERDQPRETSPSGKPKTRTPIDETIDITVVEKASRTKKDETTLEETEYQFPVDRPRDRSPSGKPSVRSYPRDLSPKKPIGEDFDETIVTKSRIPFDDKKSPLQRPQGPDSTEETIVYTTRITSQIEDHPRDRSPSYKPATRSHPRDKSPIDKPASKTYPADKLPSDKPSRPRPSKLEETTNRSTMVRKTVQETDFEKRYPRGRPGDQSPSEKPSTLRRPSKLSTTTTSTTTTRNRSTLDEQDINRTQRSRIQPSTRDKVPTKTTPLSSPRSQPTTERRVPAELPSPVRKPKSTFGVTTKTTTTVTSRLTGATRPKPTTESPKKPSKLPVESRPSARPTERKHSPSISPDSSPSRPGSDIEIDSPYRSPNMSPSRKSPSPTRSVKLEDITETVSTMRKTTVSIDKSKPKVTHVTTAKFQVTPPTSPTKVTSSPEKFSPSSRKPSSRVPTSKPIGSKFTTDTTTTKKVTSKVYKDINIPTDSERDSEVPTDAEEVDTPLPQKPSTRKLPVTERKESAPVHRVTKVNKDVQMSRSTSENIIKTPINKRPFRNEPLETQRESPRPTVGDRSSPKTERRPSKHLSTKTINLTTFDKVINSEDMENVVIDIQHAKSSREPSPNKIVPTPVSVDVYTGRPRYPDVVQEPEDEPKRKPTVKNIPIFEEETNDFVGCQITEVSEETKENTVRARTTKFIERESSPRRQTPKIVTGDNVDSECLLSVHDKVSKFISTAEEVSKPKTSAPFRRDIPEKDVPEDDECLLTVDEKVSKFLKTADSVTKEVVISKPRRVERPSIEDLDEDLKTDECVLSVSEKVNKFTTKAEKLAPSAPQRSPELVARIERQISRPSDVESESPEGEDSPVSVRKFKPTSPLTERTEKIYTERQIDILSRPSVWEKKPKPDVKLNDIIGLTPEEEPRRKSLPKTYPEDGKSKPIRMTDSVSKRKELFENKVSTNKTTTTTIKQSSPEKRPSRPAKSPSERHPSDDSDSRYPNEFIPQFVDGYAHQEPDDDVHEDVYGSSRTRNIYEVSHEETAQRSTERSPTRKSSHPEDRPTTQTTTKSPRQLEDNTPPRRYSEDHSPRYPTRDQPSTDRYMETREYSDHTSRRRSSTQEYPERRTPYKGSPSPRRNHEPVEEPEDYTFSSRRDETTTHHTTRTVPRSPKDSPLNEPSFLDDEERDHSPARSTSTVSSQKQVTTHRSTTKRVTEDVSSRRPRRPSGNEPSTPTSGGRTPRGKAVPETVAARRNIFEKSPGDISPMPTNRRPSYMEPTKSSLEHRKDSLEITKTNYSRKSSIEEEPYEPSPRTSVKFGVGLKHKEEPKPKRKLSSSDIPNIEDVFELDLLEEMLNIVTLYEQRRRIRAQIRVVKKLLETKTKEEVSRMTKISTIRKTSSSSVRESPTLTQKRETPVRSEKYHQLTDDEIDSESIIESRHVEEHEEIIRERSISPKTKTSRIVTKVTEVRKIGEPTTTTTTTTTKRTPMKKDEPKDSKPIWATKNILKKPSDNEKVTRALSAKKTTSTSSSSMSRTQQTHRQRVATDDDCVTSSYGIGPTDEDGRPLFGIRALKKKTTTTNNTVQPSETTKVTGTVITEKYYSENGAEPVGERKVTVYSTNPEDLTDMETQYDRRDSETVKREKLSKDGVTTVTKVQKIGKYKPGEIPSLTDDAEFTKATSKMVRRGSVKEMSEKFIRKESSSSVTEKSSGYPKAGLILRTRTNSGATADAADQYEVRAKSTEYDYDSEDDVEIRSSRKHSKVVTESEDETEIRRKINTRSFLNSGGSKVTGVDDVLDRMRNADNVVVDGDTMEDREARSLLNKFLGASVLMSGMESMIPQMELRKTTAGADNKQEVKTTRVTKTIKSGTTGGSSSSPVARETCDFEEIWDEEILKQLLEKSTSYEERRSIRARLRQLMAEREGQSTTTTEKTETKKEDGGVVTTTTKVTTRTISGAPKPVSPFAKFQQLDKQNSLQSPKMFK